jgi:hypothetical protein
MKMDFLFLKESDNELILRRVFIKQNKITSDMQD